MNDFSDNIKIEEKCIIKFFEDCYGKISLYMERWEFREKFYRTLNTFFLETFHQTVNCRFGIRSLFDVSFHRCVRSNNEQTVGAFWYWKLQKMTVNEILIITSVLLSDNSISIIHLILNLITWNSCPTSFFWKLTSFSEIFFEKSFQKFLADLSYNRIMENGQHLNKYWTCVHEISTVFQNEYH